MLLKEVRHTVFKNNKRHNKLLFNLLIKEEALFISAKCRDVAEPMGTQGDGSIVCYFRTNTNTNTRGRSLCVVFLVN